MPKISVIVPHYRDLTGLDVCLAALGRQTYPKDDYEIIVADNGSPEGEDAVSRAIAGRARLVVVSERGAGPARNGGVAVATGSILAFTDSDCQPEPEWLAEGVRALAIHDFVGGQVKVLVDNAERISPTEAFEVVFAFDFETYITRKGFTGAGNLFCSRELFDKVGGFRPSVSEDVDWSHRAIAAGYRIGYAPGAIVGHPARKSWADLHRKWKRINAEMYRLQAAQKNGRILWLLRTCLLPASALAHSARVLLSPKLNSPSQRISALGILYRLRLWRFADSFRLLITERV